MALCTDGAQGEPLIGARNGWSYHDVQLNRGIPSEEADACGRQMDVWRLRSIAVSAQTLNAPQWSVFPALPALAIAGQCAGLELCAGGRASYVNSVAAGWLVDERLQVRLTAQPQSRARAGSAC